jgi:hypothetical protein
VSAALIVIAVLLGLAVLLLAVPIDVVFRFANVEALAGQVTVRWLFGLARFRIKIPDVSKPRQSTAKPKGKTEETREELGARGRRANVLAALKQSAFRRRLFRFAKSLVRAVHAHELYLRMRLGLGDPADTGRLWAMVGPLSALAQNLHHAEVCIEPEFVDPVFEFESHGRVLLIPIQFILIAVAFVLSPPSIRAWRTLKGSYA